MTPLEIIEESLGRDVYDARWTIWRACCNQPKPKSNCKNPAMHLAVRDLDHAWRLYSQAVMNLEKKP